MSVPLTVLTTSRLRSFKTCQQKHYYAYELGLRRTRASDPLFFGSAFHEGIDVLESRGIDEAMAHVDSLYWDRGDPYQHRQVRAMLWGYAEKWKDCNQVAEVVKSETVLSAPITNPETGRTSQRYRFAGKLDAIVKLHDGRLAIRETKTTGESLTSETYWASLLLDAQVSAYYRLARANGYDVSTCIFDVVHRPGIEPLLATPSEKRKYKADGTLYANQREADETPDDYEARLLADIRERPDFYYARREIPRLDADLWRYQYDVWDTSQMMSFCQRENRWSRNDRACFEYGRCEYHDLCTGAVDLDEHNGCPPGFEILTDVNPELEGVSHGNHAIAAVTA